MRPPHIGRSEVLELTAGYELRIGWEEPRRSLNESPIYQALRTKDGVLDIDFVEKSGTIGRHSRRIEAALELVKLVREVAAGKSSSPADLYKRIPGFLGLRTSSLQRLSEGTATPPSNTSTILPSPIEGPTATRDSAETTTWPGSVGISAPEPPAPQIDLFALAFKVLTGTLSGEERVDLFEAVRREVLTSSQKIAQLNADLQSQLQVEVDFVRHLPLYECVCGPLVGGVGTSCPICHTTPTDHPRSISVIDPALDQILASNIWLELGIARVFDRRGFVTYVGSHPIGLSGADHEVDILAWDPELKHLILAEVTSEVASMERLGRVLYRRLDVPAHACALVTLREAAPGVVEFGKRHIIGVIPMVRENIGQLEKWIDSTRREFGNHPRQVQTTLSTEGQSPTA